MATVGVKGLKCEKYDSFDCKDVLTTV